MTSATDELRRMLDERGVEYRTHGMTDRTWFDVGGISWFVIERENGGIAVEAVFLTPEQAIEATMGRGECGMACSPEYIECKVNFFECSECGWSGVIDDTTVLGEYPRYCPSCGRKARA